jgi:predicted HTH transcriptional regulator
MARDTLFSGESKNIEYKITLPDKSEKYMKTIVAFANTQGGKLIVGIDDKTHEIVGVANEILFQLMDGIANAISDSCMPQIIPDIEPQTIDGKTVIIVSVEAGKNRPYYLKSKGKENGTYIRVAGTSRQAFPEKIRELEMEGARISWDELTCVGYPVSKEATEKLCSNIENFRGKAGMTERSVKKEQLINWKILKQSEGQLLATNAYALLTSDYFPFSKTQCAVFKGTDRAVFLDKREFTGPIYTQIEEAVDFVLRNIRLGATIDGLVRKEKYELPPEAIREMIINAHCHRNLLDESCIQVAVYDDRLEVTSPGGLYNGLTYEEVMNGHSKIRNKAIANIFSQMGLVEAWGSGIKRIFNAAKEYDLPEPKFQEFDNMFRVELFRNNSMTESEKEAGESSEKVRGRVGEGTDIIRGYELSDTQKKIVNLLLYDRQLSAAKIAEQLSMGSRSIEKNIKKLKELGILIRHGSPKNGYWEVIDCGKKNNEDTE